MEEKRQIKISLKTAIVILLLLIIIIIVGAVISFNLLQKEKNEENEENSVAFEGRTRYFYREYEEDVEMNVTHEVLCTYSDEYDIQEIFFDETEDLSSFEVCEYMSYLDYTEYCKKWNLEQKYDYEDYNYIMFSYYYKDEDYEYIEDKNRTKSFVEAELAGLEYNNEKTVLYIWDSATRYTKDYIGDAYVIIIPTTKEPNQLNYISCSTDGMAYARDTTAKPIIYLYPKEETEVSVNLGYPEKITCSYPYYTNGWKVIAKPNGDLIDLNTRRNLYSLYYESEAVSNFKVEKEGFIVKETEVAEFLEEKLEILGLTERETEEFIIYWLPKLQENEYNYIRFAPMDEINENMPLEINPNPDTIIRVLMIYKGLDNPIDVEKQELTTPERNGFVAVEWGGVEMK